MAAIDHFGSFEAAFKGGVHSIAELQLGSHKWLYAASYIFFTCYAVKKMLRLPAVYSTRLSASLSRSEGSLLDLVDHDFSARSTAQATVSAQLAMPTAPAPIVFSSSLELQHNQSSNAVTPSDHQVEVEASTIVTPRQHPR